MVGLRRLLIVVAGLAALAGIASSRTLAASLPPCTPTLPQSIASTHFLVSYSDDPLATGYMTQAQAGAVLSAAERSYASYTATGFPAPAVGASGKTELYVMDLTQFGISAEYCNGSVVEDTSTVTGSSGPFSVDVDVFTQVTSAIGSAPEWLVNGASTWASWRALGYPSDSTADLGPFDMALDCASAYDKVNCSTKGGYENLGGSRWPFYEYLTEKFGPLFIVNIFAASGAAGGDGLVGLQNALAAKGTTLTAEYSAYAAKLLAHGWTAVALNAATPPVSGSPIVTGASTGDLPSQAVGVNHLATRFVEIDRGDGSAEHPCFAATLTLTVQIPSGVVSQPTFYWSGGGSSSVPLTVSGSTATTTIPWDTCDWQSKGYLALPNTSTSADGVSFVVSGHLTVDTTTAATASPPPAAGSTYGQVVPVTSSSVSPAISVFGPQLLKLSATATQIRLIVESNGEGSVKATLGSLSLGSSTIRPGENDLRFSVPKSALLTLRRSAAATSLLTLTPVSVDGSQTGTAVTRQVSIAPAKPVAKPAPKTKTKTKAKGK
jgi:hypothetical protein